MFKLQACKFLVYTDTNFYFSIGAQNMLLAFIMKYGIAKNIGINNSTLSMKSRKILLVRAKLQRLCYKAVIGIISSVNKNKQIL